MKITRHGVRTPFYKGVMNYYGQRLVFFGYSIGEVLHKAQQWRVRKMVALPELKLIEGGRV